MNYKKVGFGLGLFSIGLGAVELLAAKRIAKALDVEGWEKLIRGFGAREVLAGVNLLAAPAVSSNVWNRVAGDVMDMGALIAAAVARPRNGAIWGAIAFVSGASALDVVTARGLDEETGPMLPVHVA